MSSVGLSKCLRVTVSLVALAAGCADVQSSLCEGGERQEDGECVCPEGRSLRDGVCTDDENPCATLSCDDGNECTDDACVVVVDEATCPFVAVADGTACDRGGGACMNGECEATPELCVGVVCDDQNPCTDDGVCDGATGMCPNPTFVAVNTVCDGGGACDGDGNCVARSWGVAELIETNNEGFALEPDVALDPNGNGLAVWRHTDGTRANIWANRYTPSGGWGSAELIETNDAGDAFDAQVALDANGNGLAVWSQSDETRFKIWANRYTPSGGWGGAELIETNDAGGASNPRVALGADGSGLAVWSQYDGTRNNIWANRFTPSEGWGSAELIETNAGSAQGPQVALDANGNGLAVWSQTDGRRPNIWANRFAPSGGWGSAELIETNDDGGGLPQVALDPNGNGLAVWRQFDVEGTTESIWANRFTSVGWANAELLIENNVALPFGPQVALDPNGNGLALWFQPDGTRNNIWANRFTPSGGWGSAELIETNDAGGASDPQVALDANGSGLAVWSQSDGTRNNIWANRFE